MPWSCGINNENVCPATFGFFFFFEWQNFKNRHSVRVLTAKQEEKHCSLLVLVAGGCWYSALPQRQQRLLGKSKMKQPHTHTQRPV